MINVTYFTAVILISLRLLAFTFVVPVFFPKGTPEILKVMFTLIFAFILMPGIDYSYVSTINSGFQLIYFCIDEIITGLVLGFMASICFHCIRFAGSILDMQIGFGMLSMFDPTSNSNITLIERVIYWFSIIVFFVVDGHHMLIKTLVESFNIVHIGKFILSQKGAMQVIDVFIKYFELGLRIAIPIIIIIIITDLTMGLVAKTVPQLNVMILGLPIKILLGLTVVSLSLPIIYNILSVAFDGIPSSIREFYKFIPLIIIFASDDKTEDATPHKLSEAKKKGQVAKSKEVNSALTLLASTIIIITLGEYIANSLKSDIIEFLGNGLDLQLSMDTLQGIIVQVIIRCALSILPVVVPIMVIGVAANVIQTGYMNSTEALKPNLSKINPISGFKKIFSMRSLVDLVKNLAVVVVVGTVGYNFLKSNFKKILSIGNLVLPEIGNTFFKLAIDIFFRVTIIMIAIAIIDFVYQKYQFGKDMRMTKQEIKEEYKQMEGDPQIKGKIRQKQREMASRRMMQQVPDASVVITNPTHIAVALKYESGKTNAPILVAKGTGYIAIKIKQIAKENGVTIIENKPLARLIYDKVELENEIPQEMYQAVAEILALVLKLKKPK